MPRKTRVEVDVAGRAADASMRPRPDAAENLFAGDADVDVGRRFNEAAARCRGKPVLSNQVVAWGAAASMRPRPDAAENAS